MIKLLALILLAVPSFASGPKYGFEDAHLNDELLNVYHDIGNAFNISTVTVRALVVSSGTLNMSGHKIVGLANGTAASDAAAIGQLTFVGTPVIAIYTGTSSTGNAAYTATGFTVTITPTSASHRVLLMVNHMLQISSTNQGGATIYTGGSDILGGTVWGYARLNSAGGTIETPVSFQYIHSPGTTSSVTYEIRIKATSGTVQVGDATISMIAWECL